MVINTEEIMDSRIKVKCKISSVQAVDLNDKRKVMYREDEKSKK